MKEYLDWFLWWTGFMIWAFVPSWILLALFLKGAIKVVQATRRLFRPKGPNDDPRAWEYYKKRCKDLGIQ